MNVRLKKYIFAKLLLCGYCFVPFHLAFSMNVEDNTESRICTTALFQAYEGGLPKEDRVKLAGAESRDMLFTYLSEEKEKAEDTQLSKIVESNGVNLWCETFGDPANPPILLVAGGGYQSIMWPNTFCENLGGRGFFVIRYDHRDVGFSTPIDYSVAAYTVMDLTKDAIGLLDHYNIQKAHIVGLSMGGQIAQFAAAYFPHRLFTLILIATSSNFEPLWDALDNKSTSSALSKPSDRFLMWAKDYYGNSSQYSEQERSQGFMKGCQIFNGETVPFDKDYYQEFVKQHFKRSKYPDNVVNHVYAMKASFKDHEEALPLIKTPTLIIQGKHDPIFYIDHAESLQESIKGSKLFVGEHMGHFVNTQYQGDVVDAIVEHINEIFSFSNKIDDNILDFLCDSIP
jgi:pimeloyl-ACP methyl ester carboxylesterase